MPSPHRSRHSRQSESSLSRRRDDYLPIVITAVGPGPDGRTTGLSLSTLASHQNQWSDDPDTNAHILDALPTGLRDTDLQIAVQDALLGDEQAHSDDARSSNAGERGDRQHGVIFESTLRFFEAQGFPASNSGTVRPLHWKVGLSGLQAIRNLCGLGEGTPETVSEVGPGFITSLPEIQGTEGEAQETRAIDSVSISTRDADEPRPNPFAILSMATSDQDGPGQDEDPPAHATHHWDPSEPRNVEAALSAIVGSKVRLPRWSSVTRASSSSSRN